MTFKSAFARCTMLRMNRFVCTMIYYRDYAPGQQCCYGDDGNIITGNNGGTADLIAPTNWKTTLLHFLVDVYPWILCCTGLFKDCGRYTSRRPVDDCTEWPECRPPGTYCGSVISFCFGKVATVKISACKQSSDCTYLLTFPSSDVW